MAEVERDGLVIQVSVSDSGAADSSLGASDSSLEDDLFSATMRDYWKGLLEKKETSSLSPIPETPTQPEPTFPPPGVTPEDGPSGKRIYVGDLIDQARDNWWLPGVMPDIELERQGFRSSGLPVSESTPENPGGYLGDLAQGGISGVLRVAQAVPELGAWASSGIGNLFGQEHGPFEQGLESASDYLGGLAQDPLEDLLGPSRVVDPIQEWQEGDILGGLADLPIGIVETLPQLAAMLGVGAATGGAGAAPSLAAMLPGIATGVGLEAGAHRSASRAEGHGDQDLGTLGYGLGAGALEALGARGVGKLLREGARGGVIPGMLKASFSEGVTEGAQASYEQLIQNLEGAKEGFTWEDAATEALLGALTGGTISGVSQIASGPPANWRPPGTTIETAPPSPPPARSPEQLFEDLPGTIDESPPAVLAQPPQEAVELEPETEPARPVRRNSPFQPPKVVTPSLPTEETTEAAVRPATPPREPIEAKQEPQEPQEPKAEPEKMHSGMGGLWDSVKKVIQKRSADKKLPDDRRHLPLSESFAVQKMSTKESRPVLEQSSTVKEVIAKIDSPEKVPARGVAKMAARVRANESIVDEMTLLMSTTKEKATKAAQRLRLPLWMRRTFDAEFRSKRHLQGPIRGQAHNKIESTMDEGKILVARIQTLSTDVDRAMRRETSNALEHEELARTWHNWMQGVGELPAEISQESREAFSKAKKEVKTNTLELLEKYDDTISELAKEGFDTSALKQEKIAIEEHLGTYLHGNYGIYRAVSKKQVLGRQGHSDTFLRKGSHHYKQWVETIKIDRIPEAVESMMDRLRDGPRKERWKNVRWNVPKGEEDYLRRATGLEPKVFTQGIRDIGKKKLNTKPAKQVIQAAAELYVDREILEKDYAIVERGKTKRPGQPSKDLDPKPIKGRTTWISESFTREVNEAIQDLDSTQELIVGGEPVASVDRQDLEFLVKDLGRGRFLSEMERILTGNTREEIALKTRIPQDIREAMGELINPKQVLMDTGAVTINRIVQLDTLRGIRSIGLMKGGFLSDVQASDYVEVDVPASNPLHGLFIDPEVKNQIMGMDDLADQGPIMSFAWRVMSRFKMHMTILRPMTQSRNIIVNPSFLIALGFAPTPSNIKNSQAGPVIKAFLKAMKKAGLEGDSLYLDRIAAGLDEEVGADVSAAMMEATEQGLMAAGSIEDINAGIFQTKGDIERANSKMDKAGYGYEKYLDGKLGGDEKIPILPKERAKFFKALEQFLRPWEILYQFGDDVFRTSIYFLEKDRLSPKSLSEGDTKGVAKWVANHCFANYKTLPRIAQRIRRTPVTGPFIAWPVATAMSLKNSILKTAADLGSKGAQKAVVALGHPDLSPAEWGKMKSIGGKRLAGLSIIGGVQAGVGSMLLELVRNSTDYDDDEDTPEIGHGRDASIEAWRALAGPWGENSNYIPFGEAVNEGDDVFVRALDTSFLSIHDYILKPLTALSRVQNRNQNVGEALYEVIQEFADPFVSLELGLVGIIESATGSKWNGFDSKRPLIDRVLPDEANFSDYSWWTLSRMIDAGALPGFVSAFVNVGESFGPHSFSKNIRGKKPTEEILAQTLGWRTQNMSMNEELHYAVVELVRGITDIKSMTKKAERSASDFERWLTMGGDPISRAERQFKEATLDFQHQIWAIKRLSGWSTYQIYDKIKKNEKTLRLPKETLWNILQGLDKYDPHISLYSSDQRRKMRYEMNQRRLQRQQGNR